MPQPVVSGTPLTATFGGLNWPNGQGAFPTMNLNDGAQWQWQQFQHDDDYVQITPAQLVWRAASVVLGRDRKSRVLTLPMRYLEAGTSPSQSFGVQKGLLDQAGQQRLSFDGFTYILAEYSGIKSHTWPKNFPPFYHSFSLEFFCPVPYFLDISATTLSPQALSSGSATTFNVTYAGSIWTAPVWTLTIPNTNAAPIQSFALSNTMSGEAITIAFPGNLAAGTAWTITIDSNAMTVTDGSGHGYDIAGSAFPLLYGPAGQVNAMSATLTPASGTATGCTIGATWNPRWLI